MNNKVFVSCAVTGSGDAAKKHPDLPKTPEQIAKAAIEAAKAGAAIAHIHVREEDGKPSRRLELYKEVVDRVRSSGTDVVLNLTTGMNEEKINIKNSYKGLLLDLEGVIYEGNKLIDGSIETINKLSSHGFKIRYLTNTTTTSRRLIFEKLLQFKLPLNESDIFTPAIAANLFLKKKNISKISLFTSQLLKEDFTDFEIENLKPEAIILGDLYKDFSWEKLNKAFQNIIENNSLIIALHKNRYCKRGNKIGLDLGPFVAALEYATSKKSILIGKPEKKFFNLAIEDMKLKNEEVIMIGDDIVSDIVGAKKVFLSTIQVKTGKFQKKDESSEYFQPDYRINSISELPYILGVN